MAPLAFLMQIYDLETKYLDQSSAFGNAVRGTRYLFKSQTPLTGSVSD